MDPYESPFIISNSSLRDPMTHSPIPDEEPDSRWELGCQLWVPKKINSFQGTVIKLESPQDLIGGGGGYHTLHVTLSLR